MPYVRQEFRPDLEDNMNPKSAGELNYCVHVLIARFFEINNDFGYEYVALIAGLLSSAENEAGTRSGVVSTDVSFVADNYYTFASNVGELMDRFIYNRTIAGTSRPKINLLLRGIMRNVSQEFYRRVAVPYERKKIRENGDVRPYSSGLLRGSYVETVE